MRFYQLIDPKYPAVTYLIKLEQIIMLSVKPDPNGGLPHNLHIMLTGWERHFTYPTKEEANKVYEEISNYFQIVNNRLPGAFVGFI